MELMKVYVCRYGHETPEVGMIDHWGHKINYCPKCATDVKEKKEIKKHETHIPGM